MPDNKPSQDTPLSAAALALKLRLLSSLNEANISAKVTFQQVTTPSSQGGLSGIVEVVDTATVSAAESVLKESLSITARKWLSKIPGETPRLELKAVIPPDVKPATWLQLVDPPNVFVFAIQGTLDMADADQPTVLKFPEDNPSVALVMKGGGIKGLAYVGALEVLWEHFHFNHFVGTSAGAVTAILLGAGYEPEELKPILEDKDFRDFFDAPWWKKPLNFIFRGGFNRAQAFTTWMHKLVAKKLLSATPVKLCKLPIHTTVYASRRGKSALPFDSKVENDDIAAYAARCSMSIPMVFTPELHQGLRTYDGGLQNNFPLKKLLEKNPETKFLAFYLGPEIYEPPSRDPWELWELVGIWTEGSDEEMLEIHRRHIVMIDPAPIGTLDFDLTPDEKSYLLQCGRVGALAYLQRNSVEHQQAVEKLAQLRPSVDQSCTKRHKKKAFRKKMIIVLFLTACSIPVMATGGLIVYGMMSWLADTTPAKTTFIEMITNRPNDIMTPGPASCFEVEIVIGTDIDWVKGSVLKIVSPSGTELAVRPLGPGFKDTDPFDSLEKNSAVAEIEHPAVSSIRLYMAIRDAQQTGTKASRKFDLTSLDIYVGDTAIKRASKELPR